MQLIHQRTKLAKYLAHSLRPFSGLTATYVKNSSHFIKIIKEATISEDDLLVSFDVVSLFTKIPIEDAIEVIKTLTEKGLPKDIPKMVEFCLQNCYFSWGGKLYERTEGASMGSPLSPVVADLYMEEFDRKALDSFPTKPKLFVRYVNDTFVI